MNVRHQIFIEKTLARTIFDTRAEGIDLIFLCS